MSKFTRQQRQVQRRQRRQRRQHLSPREAARRARLLQRRQRSRCVRRGRCNDLHGLDETQRRIAEVILRQQQLKPEQSHPHDGASV